MNPNDEKHEIIESEKYNNYFLNNNLIISKRLDLSNGKELISYYKNKELKALEEGSKRKNVSIGISAAVTAYGRISMSSIKNNKDINLYYFDTDSGVTDKPLPI